MAYKTFTIKSNSENIQDISFGEISQSLIDNIKNTLTSIISSCDRTVFNVSVRSSSASASVTHSYTANYCNIGWSVNSLGTISIHVGTATPSDISYFTSQTSSADYYTDTQRTYISNKLNEAYNVLMFYTAFRKVTNINTACDYALNYQWRNRGSTIPIDPISFSNGSYIKRVVSGSAQANSWAALKKNNNTSAYGCSDAFYQYYSTYYVANYNSQTSQTTYSGIFLTKGTDDNETIRNGINGNYYHIINRVNMYTLNSNGEFTQARGRRIDIDQPVQAASIYGIFPDSNTINDFEVKEIFEDTENTYPGGGEDKNDYPDEDSEEPGGESGKGDFDNTNDPIDFPTLPTWDVQSTGFISLWNPTIVQLTDLYTFLWDSDISTTLKKLFNEPMNAIFSLGIVPVDPVTQGTRRLTIGHVDTEIDMESIQKQFVTFDFGSIDINEYYGAAWDYSPYTQASIYLPYIGVQPVDIDDIMNCTLTLRYNIDVLTGTTIALLKCVRKGRDNLNAVMYEWQGNCVTQCPITAGNWSQIMASVIQLGAMTGLALSQPVVGAIGSAVGSSAAAEYAHGKNLVNPTMATYGALNVLGSKVHVQRGGRIDMSAGAMSMQKAYVILNRPISGIPRGWNKYAGYPSLKIKTLGSQEGFVSVGAIKLDGLRATAEEINELDTILKTGVII